MNGAFEQGEHLPLFTESLRIFSNLSGHQGTQDPSVTDPVPLILRMLRARDPKQELIPVENGAPLPPEGHITIPWRDLCQIATEIVASQNGRQKATETRDKLNNIYSMTAKVMGEDAPPAGLEEGAVFFFRVFLLSSQLDKQRGETVRKMFGPFPSTVVTQIGQAVQSVLVATPALRDMLSPPDTSTAPPPKEHSVLNPRPFGAEIRFSPVSSDVTELPADYSDEFTHALSVETGDTMNNGIEEFATETQDLSSRFAPYWLLDQLRLLFLQPEARDKCGVIINLLSGPEGDEGIAETLFECLGDTGIELVHTLLENRFEICRGASPQLFSLDSVPPVGSNRTRGPIIAGSVLVQSQQEKELARKLRKGRKNEARLADKAASAEDSQLTRFDPKILRAQRELELREAKRRPLFSGAPGVSDVHASDLYPHVFDELGKLKMVAASIGQFSISLPSNAVRRDTVQLEEVRIPVSEGDREFIDSFPQIPVGSLDDLVKKTFKEKKLNVIQSRVYETVYNSNENLLVCAPTGAGKTNIALLAMLHSIKQYWYREQVSVEEFKIVYVAPMKALAAEIVRKMSERLGEIGIVVRELTGDMQLSRTEIKSTHVIVTTPEKWDVVTRKSTGDVSLALSVKLLIIDEVHLLHDDRGPVLESLVARTVRQVETSQKMIRIVGLSATLPNYLDVARFLRVNPHTGLFFFDSRFRPVPLCQTFIGVKGHNKMHQLREMDLVCYDKALAVLKEGHQVMVFVHARNATVKTAEFIKEQSKNKGDTQYFRPPSSPAVGIAEKAIMKCHYTPLKQLFHEGILVHHAGMPRKDRTLVEDLFTRKLAQVLVCTATLAWGVNLPARAVIIKGTQIYDAEKSAFVDIGILDVLQIFGRAGRPQYDSMGEGMIITTHDKLHHYLSLLTRQKPIESQFIDKLADNLNAELVLGTVTSVEEAVQWLKYTYLYVRMQVSPITYGIKIQTGAGDRGQRLDMFCHELITKAATNLDKIKMVRFTERTGYIFPTDLGRTASHFYIKYDTIDIINQELTPHLDDSHLFALISKAREFQQVKVREEEMPELKMLENECWFQVMGGPGHPHGKVNILLQSYISRKRVETFSLISDLHYISQNGGRILRGLFDIALKKGWPRVSQTLLLIAKCVDWQLWPNDHPLCQMQSMLSHDLFEKLRTREDLNLFRLQDMDENEIGRIINYQKGGSVIKKCVKQFPCIELKSVVQPITRTVLRVRVTILPRFEWNERIHGNSLSWWLWVTDSENDHMYYTEFITINKKQVRTNEDIDIVFTIPIFEPLPDQYLLFAVSDLWLHSETQESLSFKHLVLPEVYPPHSELLDLQPLQKKVLQNEDYESIFSFSYFNPIQTQVFHSVYHSDQNILLGAPTGSGKTVIAELAMLRVFNHYPGAKCVYIAPLKALVRERMKDWKVRLETKLRKKVVELTGDVTPDVHSILSSDVIVTTPEKWDGISRSWQTRSYVRSVMLLIIDEIHLLGEDRGPVLEVIVSRTNFISSQTDSKLRIIGLSTALANARDLAEWLGIKPGGLFNFKPSVRPVPLEVHIDGFPGKHYCPRMATMNKPSFKAVKTHSPHKPVLIFVSSRRQTRLTALDLIGFLALEGDPKQWLHMEEDENLDRLLREVQDPNLCHFLSFGIGVHHAGLHENDRKMTEQLFVDQRIQILIATSTLAWGVNFPAHLVIVKGTEYYDGKLKRYVDFPITDVLQMMGRAGRPQFDDEGVAVILVHNIKKDFYKKFLYEPFPVESSLLAVIPDHLNAEIVSGSIKSRQDCIDYMTWTYLFRRLFLNPTYYKLEGIDEENVNTFLSTLIADALCKLETARCITVEETGEIRSLQYGRVASFYYLRHGTMRIIKQRISNQCGLVDLIKLLCDVEEYAELPVRHNEDNLNKELASSLPLEVLDSGYESPHTKAFLLYQSHFSRSTLPIADYYTDRKTVMDQTFRILQAILDVVAGESLLQQTLLTIHLIQMVTQACWLTDSSLLMLPHVTSQTLQHFKFINPSSRQIVVISSIAELMRAEEKSPEIMDQMLKEHFTHQQIFEMTRFIKHMPNIQLEYTFKVQLDDETVSQVDTKLTSNRTVTVHRLLPGKEHIVQVRLRQMYKRAGVRGNRAETPRFPKSKDEGWWVILGQKNSKSLISMKRVSSIKRISNISLAFTAPTNPAHHTLSLLLMSDSYIGLDQQYDLHVEIINSAATPTDQ